MRIRRLQRVERCAHGGLGRVSKPTMGRVRVAQTNGMSICNKLFSSGQTETVRRARYENSRHCGERIGVRWCEEA